jgi:hypothetical protein
MKIINENSRSPGRSLNPGPPEYEHDLRYICQIGHKPLLIELHKLSQIEIILTNRREKPFVKDIGLFMPRVMQYKQRYSYCGALTSHFFLYINYFLNC